MRVNLFTKKVSKYLYKAKAPLEEREPTTLLIYTAEAKPTLYRKMV